MSRIDEAWKRMTGVAAEPRSLSPLERFAPEEAVSLEESTVSNLEETKVSSFIAAGPRPVIGRPSAPREAPAPAASVRDTVASVPEAAAFIHGRSMPDEVEPNVQLHSDPHVDSEKLADFRQIANYAGFLAGSLRRHKFLAAGTFLLAFAMTVFTAISLPKTYHVQAKLLAQRNAVMASLSNPGRAVPWDADAPTRAASETVLRHDNLLSLISKTNLLEEWNRTRVPILKLKDWLTATILRRRPGPEEQLEQLVGLLEARLMVAAGPVGDGTVTIDLDWPDAQMAYRLVEGAQEAFVEARKAAETAAISESIAILERSGLSLHDDINRTLEELQRSKAHRLQAPAPRERFAPSIAAVLPPIPEEALGVPALGVNLDDPEIPRLKAAVASRRQEIASLEDARQRQLSDLQARLVQLSTVYTQTHPSVVSVHQNIAVLSKDSPQLVALKADTERLEVEYQKHVAAAEEVLQEAQLNAEAAKQASAGSAQESAPQPRNARTLRPAQAEQPSAAGGETPDFASVRLRLELNQLESILERTDGARIELAVSQAAFKYRYTVVRPAQVPRSPVRPNLKMIFVAGFLGSLLLALAAVVAKDLMSNRILELWQIERQLGLPILGSLGNA